MNYARLLGDRHIVGVCTIEFLYFSNFLKAIFGPFSACPVPALEKGRVNID
jgi:hypothetical protein